MIRAGELRHLVELQEPTGESRDEYGHTVPQWTTRAKLWCKIEQLTASEQTIADQQFASSTTQVTTRFHRGVQPSTTWRLKHGNRLLCIASVNNVDNRNEEWRFICGEKANG